MENTPIFRRQRWWAHLQSCDPEKTALKELIILSMQSKIALLANFPSNLVISSFSLGKLFSLFSSKRLPAVLHRRLRQHPQLQLQNSDRLGLPQPLGQPELRHLLQDRERILRHQVHAAHGRHLLVHAFRRCDHL